MRRQVAAESKKTSKLAANVAVECSQAFETLKALTPPEEHAAPLPAWFIQRFCSLLWQRLLHHLRWRPHYRKDLPISIPDLTSCFKGYGLTEAVGPLSVMPCFCQRFRLLVQRFLLSVRTQLARKLLLRDLVFPRLLQIT